MNCDKVETMPPKQPQGILRRRSSYGGSPARAQSPSRRLSSRVHFAPPENFSELLSSHNFPALEGFITHMRNQQVSKARTRDNNSYLRPNATSQIPCRCIAIFQGFILLQGEALVAWLQALAENLALLKPKLEPFVLATLDIPWADKEKPIVAAFTYV